VTEAGSLEQDDVLAAHDRAEVADAPGGPAKMNRGQYDLRLNLHIAMARDGRFEVVEQLGAIDPQERPVAAPAVAV
jgi:branched-chain amino acid transport system substrate-binding protein